MDKNDLVASSCPFCGFLPDHYISVCRGVASDSIKLRLICRTCDIEMVEYVQSGSPWYRVDEANKKLFERWNARKLNV